MNHKQELALTWTRLRQGFLRHSRSYGGQNGGHVDKDIADE